MSYINQNSAAIANLMSADPLIGAVLSDELDRQQHQLEMIASENFTSLAVMAAQGSVLTNKYAEGYPGKRYYGGCGVVDRAETLAINRACQLFSCAYANVQPHAGAPANQHVFFALLNPGDTILGLDLNCGGHLTHGSKVNMSGKWFNAIAYQTDPETGLIDYDQVEQLAKTHRPKLIIAGGSAYPRIIDFARFRSISDQVSAYFMVDMAHFAGLVAGGVFPSPIPHAHVVTTTTHKTLRGPRGGMILCNDLELGKKFNAAVFPGLQGGPLMHVIAAKAVAFGEALQPSFKIYAAAVIENAKALGKVLTTSGLSLVTGGTDCHLILVDLRSLSVNGADACEALENAGITANKNSIPFDPLPPSQTSGIRLGSPALTTRGMGVSEFREIGGWVFDVLKTATSNNAESVQRDVRSKVVELCRKFPLYADQG